MTIMSTSPSDNMASRKFQVTCPCCGQDCLYAPSNPFRPFCSERCKMIDLGAWSSESLRLPADAPPDDAVFGDPSAL